jgi:peptidoglycan/xylan/chitin deacetylase (PgdA/CDA1 family)
MAGNGITFGAHTVTHPILTCLPLGEAIEEIQSSRASIETKLGIRVRLFAYPNGGRSDYNEAIKGVLREMGFLGALTNLRGANNVGSDPYELHRETIGDADPKVSALKLLWYKFAGQ